MFNGNPKTVLIRAVLILLLFALSFKASAIEPDMPAEEASLNGFVKDSKTQETLIGATVYLKGTSLGTYTNKSGFFSVKGIDPGEYTIVVSSLGYKKYETIISFKQNESIRKTFELEPTSLMSEEVLVEAEREAEKRQITISKVNVPIKTIKEIRVGGESDVFRTLQFLPGILTSSQISSGLFVRGGSPDQNLVLLDGATVYNPTHLFGFISTFNSNAIKDVDLEKGGFQAEHGGRMSAVLNITQKDGNRSELEGNASLGAISSSLNLEGPMPGVKGSWFIGGRRTYFELVKEFLPDDPENPIPDFNFYDLNGKISLDLDNSTRAGISGFTSADNLDYASFGVGMNLDVGNNLLSGKITRVFGDNMFANGILSYSRYYNIFEGDQSGYEFLVDNSIRDISGKLHLEWFTSEDLTIKLGTEATFYRFNYLQNFTGDTDSTAEGSDAGITNLTIDDVVLSAYMQGKYSFTDLLSLQLGLRASYWDMSEEFVLDPRMAFRYQLQENIAVKAAWGIYHQYLRLATQPDFTFFDTWLPTDSTVPPSYATHYIFSMETKPYKNFDLNFDIYYKTFENLSEINTTTLEGETVSDVFYLGKGDAYGFEVFLQRKYGRFTGWLGYAMGFINVKFDSINSGKIFRPKYDRRHDFKIVGQYQIGDRWNVGATFTFQSGQSYTGATSRLQSRLPGQTFGRGKIVPSERYGLRLPASHQLNVNASYSFDFFGKLNARAILDVYNVYSRRDIWFRYYNTQELNTSVEDVRLLPILPTFSIEVNF